MSNADEILKLKELLDSKIITQKEFEKKKKELLDIKETIETPTQKVNNSKKGFLNKLGIENNITLTSKKNKSKSNKKSSPTGIILLLIVIVFMVTVGSSTDKQYEKINKEKELFNQYSISYDNVKSVLQNCGYTNYTITRDIEMDNYWGEGTIAFQITYNDNNLSGITIKDGSIYNVFYIKNELYRDGQVICKISDFFLTDDEKYNYIDIAKEAVKSKLNYPNTAKFPWLYDEYTVSYTDRSKIIVKGQVTSSNAFGVSTTNTFEVTFENDVITNVILY